MIVAGGGQGLAVGRNGKRKDIAGGNWNDSPLFARGNVPQPNCQVIGARGQRLAVGRDGY